MQATCRIYYHFLNNDAYRYWKIDTTKDNVPIACLCNLL